MCGAKGKVTLLFATYAFLTCVVNHSCRAQVKHNTSQDCASSCGNIHNIAYPFRLNTDPKHCGTEKYQLSCENNVAMLYFKRSREPAYGLRVQAINYNNFTIRLSNPNYHIDNCSLPVAYRSEYDYVEKYQNNVDYSVLSFNSTTTIYLFRSLTFISCEHPRSGSDNFYDGSQIYEYSSLCKLSRHWYLKVDRVEEFEMENSCRVKTIAVTSFPIPLTAPNITYSDVKNSFAYGFELSWVSACCSTEVSTKYNCSVWKPIGYCVLNSPSIRAHLDRNMNSRGEVTICGLIFYSLVAILGFLELYRALLCFLGYICVTIYLIYKWRRRHQYA